MIWQEMSYNKYNNQGDLFRIDELWNENDNNVIYSSYELDIIEKFNEQ